MTACVNKKHSRRVAAAVSASLVGALTLGAAPAVVFAATPEAGVETQSVDPAEAFGKGTLTAADDIDGQSITIPTNGVITFTADGRPQGVVPTEMTVALGTTTVKVPIVDGGYDLKYYVANDQGISTGDLVNRTGEAPYAVGKYVARLEMTSGTYKGGIKNIPFEIKAAKLENLSAVDTEDGSFEFDGTDQLANIAYKMNDLLLDKDLFDIKGVTYTYKKGASFEHQTVSQALYAGDYSVVLVGKDGTAYAGSETEVKFTVTPLDLKNAKIVLQDVQLDSMTSLSGYKPTIVSINGKTPNRYVRGALSITFKSGPNGSNLVWERGQYTYTVSANDVTDQVVNSQDVTFNAVDALVPANNFTYQGKPFANMPINRGLGQSFTPDKIAVSYNGKALDKSAYTVTATNMGTGETTTDLSKVNTPGFWNVVATINCADEGINYTIGGTASMVVVTFDGYINADANVYFVYDNQVVKTKVNDEYDGTDKLAKLQVAVSDTFGKQLTEGKDYTVTAYDKAGNKVDQVVDAGTYTIEVTSTSHLITNAAFKDTLTLVVDPVSVYDLRVARDAFVVYGEQAFLPYTGSAITPGIEYKDSEDEWHVLPSDLYTLTYEYSEDYSGTYKKVDEMDEEGYYKISLHAVRDNDPNWGLKNDLHKGFWQVDGYEAGNKIVRVTASRLFADVANNTWYSQPVYDAVDMGYMNGYNGTSFFGPEDSITRGQVACVLFNMAGGEPIYDEEWFDKNVGTNTPFDDVDPNAYYARAIAWAAKAGVVNGYQDGTFHPDQAVSAQEFACMLANYAKATGVDVDAAEADLSEYPGGDQVAGFAKESMEWAVSEGIMGNNGANLAPTSSIMRCRVAAMAVNFQPDGAFDSVFEFSAKE